MHTGCFCVTLNHAESRTAPSPWSPRSEGEKAGQGGSHCRSAGQAPSLTSLCGALETTVSSLGTTTCEKDQALLSEGLACTCGQACGGASHHPQSPRLAPQPIRDLRGRPLQVPAFTCQLLGTEMSCPLLIPASTQPCGESSHSCVQRGAASKGPESPFPRESRRMQTPPLQPPTGTESVACRGRSPCCH